MQKLPISVCILSWKSGKTIVNSLESYRKFGLLELTDDVVVLFQEVTEEDMKIASLNSIKYIGLKENVGIGKGLTLLVENATYENILFLEHDWELVEEESLVYSRLKSGLELLKGGFDIVRYRSRKNPGYPCFEYQYQGNELNNPAHLLSSLHWLDPALEFPNLIQRRGEYFVTSSRWAAWVNHPFLARKNFLLENVALFAGKGVTLESNIRAWWAQQNFKVAHGEGLFKHHDLVKHHSGKQNKRKIKNTLRKHFNKIFSRFFSDDSALIIWLSKRYKILKSAFDRRYSSKGAVSVFLRKAEKAHQLIDKLKHPDTRSLDHEHSGRNYWFSNYKNIITESENFNKKSRYFLQSAKAPSIGNWLYQCIKNRPDALLNGILDLNGIKLPEPQEKDEDGFGLSVLEILMPHLLNLSLEEIRSIDYDFYCAIPDGPYEYHHVYIEPNDIVIDAGANYGFFSALAVFRGAVAYAFEPSQLNRENYLQKTVDLNPQVRIVSKALSNSKKNVTLGNEISRALGTSHISERSQFARKDRGKTEIVEAIDLDSFVFENKLPRVDFIKADIGGAEREMLRGAQSVLKEFAPKLALSTYHLPDDPGVLRGLILQANPNYIIEQKSRKLYAYVPTNIRSALF